MEAAFTQPDACAEHGLAVNPTLSFGTASLSDDPQTHHRIEACGYDRRRVREYRCRWEYVGGSTGSRWEFHCGHRYVWKYVETVCWYFRPPH